jgi:CheY-like chemotaxis protein
VVVPSHTILVVEETDLVRRTTKRVLSKRGYRVLEAANATEALTVLATPQVHVDLVLIGTVHQWQVPLGRH